MVQHYRLLKLKTLALLLISIMFAALLAPSDGASAQSSPPPLILNFELSANSETLTVAQVEAGNVTATMGWQVINAYQGLRVEITQRVGADWQNVFNDDLSAQGEREFFIIHGLDFNPPMYRLRIYDDMTGAVYDSAYRHLDYTEAIRPPLIERFNADASSLDPNTGRLSVAWQVAYRSPTSQLRFMQVFEDGSLLNIEAERPVYWVPSQGEGVVLPQIVPDSLLQIRLQVIDLRDNSLLAESDVRVPVGEAAEGEPVILSFEASPNPIEREGSVTVAWSVTGAEVIQVGQVTPDGRFIRPTENMPANGSMNYRALPNSYYQATFFLYAGDGSGRGQTQTISVNVTCPFTFTLAEAEGCPLAAEATFPAAYQLFDRGEMLWRSDRNEIIVLYNDGTYERFPDTYVEGEELNYPPAALEAELGDENSLPIRGFGKVWANNPQVANNLGYAIGTEVGYEMRGQAVANGRLERGFTDEFLTFPDGSVTALYVDNTWLKIE